MVEKQKAFTDILISAIRAGLTNSALFTLDSLGTPYTGLSQLDEDSILNLHNLGHNKGYAGKSADEVRSYIRMHHMDLINTMVNAFKNTPEEMEPCLTIPSSPIKLKTAETHHSNGIEQPIIMLAGKNTKNEFYGSLHTHFPGMVKKDIKPLAIGTPPC